jgi:hypothetical protein
MRPLTARRALDAWEQGQRSDSSDRALGLLAASLPEVDRERLAHLPLGRRDALLIRLRERTFGNVVKSFTQCPKCSTRLEFPIDLRGYDVAGSLKQKASTGSVSADGFEIRFRLPDSDDLAEISFYPDVEVARRFLVSRCVLSVEKDGRPVSPLEIPEPVLERLGAAMEELDPLSFLPLSIECVRCKHQWLVLLDIATLLWQEISVSAERLLQDVHKLALAYGWSETEILGMSDARRKFYLTQIPKPAAAATPAKRI